MIMNALNTTPHSMYILCDTWQQRHIYWFKKKQNEYKEEEYFEYYFKLSCDLENS